MKEKIKTILDKIILDEDYIDSDNFVDDGYIDSFDIVSIVSELNKQFGIQIIMKDIQSSNFVNIDTIIDLVNKYKEL